MAAKQDQERKGAVKEKEKPPHRKSTETKGKLADVLNVPTENDGDGRSKFY